MRKYILIFCGLLMLAACDKHDPILPGTRTAIFDSGTQQNILNINVENLPDNQPDRNTQNCDYTTDSNDVVRNGNRKIFVGFPASNSMDIEIKPICDGAHVYSGLHSGSVIKIAPKNRQVMWLADVYSVSNMTGGAATVDIVAPLVIDGTYIYAGGMGDAFCKINKQTGAKKWCSPIGTRHEFVVLKNVAYITGLDKVLYAVRLTDGAIYWRRDIKYDVAPKYENKIIRVGKQNFDAATGQDI